jgi:hypothetical protein
VLTWQVFIIAVIVFIAAGITVSVLLFMKGLTVAERKKLAKYADIDQRNTARDAYKFILKLLRLEGLTGEPGEPPVAFSERVDGILMRSGNNGLSSVIDAIEKLEFSHEELTEEDFAGLTRVTADLYLQIVTEKKKFKRLLRRIAVLDIIK